MDSDAETDPTIYDKIVQSTENEVFNRWVQYYVKNLYNLTLQLSEIFLIFFFLVIMVLVFSTIYARIILVVLY